jgi:hypothetical protein
MEHVVVIWTLPAPLRRPRPTQRRAHAIGDRDQLRSFRGEPPGVRVGIGGGVPEGRSHPRRERALQRRHRGERRRRLPSKLATLRSDAVGHPLPASGQSRWPRTGCSDLPTFCQRTGGSWRRVECQSVHSAPHMTWWPDSRCSYKADVGGSSPSAPTGVLPGHRTDGMIPMEERSGCHSGSATAIRPRSPRSEGFLADPSSSRGRSARVRSISLGSRSCAAGSSAPARRSGRSGHPPPAP